MSSLLDFIDDELEVEIDGLLTPEQFLEVFRREQPERVAFDSESPTYKWMLPWADPFALTFSWSKTHTYYVTCAGEHAEEAALLLYEVLATVPELVAHHVKYDLHVANRLLSAHGLPLVTRRIDDTMLLDAVLDESRHHGLKELCTDFGIRYSDQDADVLKAQIADWRERATKSTGEEPGFDQVPLRLMVPYALQDAYLTLELFRHLSSELEAQLESGDQRSTKDLRDIYELELAFVWVAYGAEERGMRVDLDFVYEQVALFTETVSGLRARLNDTLPFDMNPGSTDDVAEALKHLGHGDAVWINPKTGKPNLPDWRMEQLANEAGAGELVHDVLAYRTAAKMLNSYFEVLLREHSLDEHGQAIVRCSIKTIGARTGRTSVTEPALQTIPREKGEVRGAFIAREGHSLIFVDYQGQELRLLGHYLAKVGDDSIRDVYAQSDADLHMETAMAVFEKKREEVERAERQQAKNINFAIVYGAGAKKVGSMVGATTEEEAQERGKVVLNRLYRRFPGLPKLKKMCETAMRNRGYVITIFGRRHREKEGRFAYKAINSLVQGSGADAAKEAAVKVDRAFHDAGMTAIICLIVHDELFVEAPDEEVERAAEIMRREMCDFPELAVPLEVEVNVAKRWSEAKG